MTQYVFDNAREQPTAQRFANLEQLYDGQTIAALAQTGVTGGWHCLEIGAGGGSIAAWLADQVGPAGQVLATDLDPRFLAALAAEHRPNVVVQQHDITVDPLPEGTFDLIHARLVLLHIPTAPAVLARLVMALRPGGWIVIEDFDPTFIDRSFPVADSGQAATAQAAYTALGAHIEARGAGPGWARGLYGHFRAAGLEDVVADGRLMIRPGDSPGARLDQANFSQARDALIAAGSLSAAEADQVIRLLEDPSCPMSSPMLFTAWGRCPSTVPMRSA